MLSSRFIAITLFLVTLCSPIYAEVDFYKLNELDSKEMASETLDSNIASIPQLLKAYIDNGTYIVGGTSTASKADPYILAKKGSKTDTFLRGDQETTRIESIIADTLLSKSEERTERVSLENEEKFKTDEQLYNRIADKFKVMRKDKWWDYTGADTIFEKLKHFGKINKYGTKISDPKNWNSSENLDENEIKYIQDEYYDTHKSEKQNYKEVKIIWSQVFDRFLYRGAIDNNNEARQKDRVACLFTAVLADTYKDLILNNQQVDFNLLKQAAILKIKKMSISAINDYLQYGQKIDLFWEKKVFPLLSTEGYFSGFWKKLLPVTNKRIADQQEYREKFQNIRHLMSRNNQIARKWDDLTVPGKLERLRVAESVIHNTKFQYDENSDSSDSSSISDSSDSSDEESDLITKEKLKFMLAALPPSLSRMFDKSLSILPENEITTTKIKQIFDGYKNLLQTGWNAPTKEQIIKFAEELPVSPYYPRLLVIKSTTDNIDQDKAPPFNQTMRKEAVELIKEIKTFFGKFNYIDQNASNYIDPTLLQMKYRTTDKDEPIKDVEEKIIIRVLQILDGLPTSHITRLKMVYDEKYKNDEDLGDLLKEFAPVKGEIQEIKEIDEKLLKIEKIRETQYDYKEEKHGILSDKYSEKTKFQNKLFPLSSDEKADMLMRKVFIRFLPLLKNFNETFRSTISSGDFIPSIMSLLSSISNCVGGQEEAVKSSANSIFFKKTAGSSGKITEVVNDSIELFINTAFAAMLPEDSHQRAAIKNAFRNNKIFNADSASEKIEERTQKDFANDVLRFISQIWGTVIPDYLVSIVESKQDKLCELYRNNLQEIDSKILDPFFKDKISELNIKIKQNNSLRPVSLDILNQLMVGSKINNESYIDISDWGVTLSLRPNAISGITLLLEKMGWMYCYGYPENFSIPNDTIPSTQGTSGIWTAQLNAVIEQVRKEKEISDMNEKKKNEKK